MRHTTMRPINLFVIHCADTPDDMDVTAQDIKNWHIWPKEDEETGLWFYAGAWHEYDSLPDDVRGQRGNGWDDIGYHAVIRRSGAVEPGRPLEQIGAHVRGHNEASIGICLVGRYEYTDAQWRSLEGLVRAYKSRWPQADVMGHCDLDSGKTCPNFSVLSWWNEAMKHG